MEDEKKKKRREHVVVVGVVSIVGRSECSCCGSSGESQNVVPTTVFLYSWNVSTCRFIVVP
jgi:hypothetical protein